MKTIVSLFLVFTFLLHGRGMCQTKGNIDSPNIIIFFTDDQGYGDLGCYGSGDIQTPHLDELAERGIRFTDFYVAASVCTPSRAALLTGKYPKQLQLHEGVISPYSTHGLAPGEETLAELLREEGYATGMIGKWHLGHAREEFMPNSQGFDYFYGVPYSNDMDGHFYKQLNYKSPPLPVYKNRELIASGVNQDSLTYWWTNAAVDYINTTRKQPFFLYIAHNMPHLPWHASENFRGSSRHGLYGDVIQEIDWSMGQIVTALQNQGKLENTLIIFTSDNGPSLIAEGGSAGPLRGGKAQTWEGGMRVPCIMSWPAKLEQGILFTAPVSTLDLMPTLASLLDHPITDPEEMAGRDVLEDLLSPNRKNNRKFELIYYNREGEPEAIRINQWKLHIKKERGWDKSKGEFPVSLYNLDDDISESHNLADHYPGLVKKLKHKLEKGDAKISR